MTPFFRITGAKTPVQNASRASRFGLAVAAILSATTVFAAPQTLSAQRINPPDILSIDSMRADGSSISVPLRKPAGFKLFAGEDFTCGYYRSTGQIGGGSADHGGPVPFNQGVNGCVRTGRYGTNGGGGYMYFEMGIVGAAPPSEWRKIRAVWPSARNATGSAGYASFWHFTVSTPNRIVIGPADGQFGKTFSGVTTAQDGSCRDGGNDLLVTGFSLMAMLDCPVTWGSEGYQGKLVVPDSAWRAQFAASPNSFTWDDFKFARASLPQTSYLGTNSFYTWMSDYFREVKLRYGSVVAGGVGTPTETGYPLGIEMRVDGWQFGSPAISSTQFYELTMVNKSADVYGTGISYDSLYYGLAPGLIVANAGGGAAFYFDLPRNTIYITGGNVSGLCTGTYPRRYLGQTNGCTTSGGTAAPVGLSNGIMAITWLKSPLGDHRNKLFSDEKSPYFNPLNPAAGDTINYNHAHFGAFGQSNMQVSNRAAFGMFSSKEDDYLDGRAPNGLQANYLSHFQPEFYDGVAPDAQNAKFNRFVPGATINPKTNQLFAKWDYNHDGVQDTISVPGCGSRGCHELFSDTVAGGYRNVWGNVLNSMSAGPFKLRAGDTTQFLWGFTWAPDTIVIRTRVDALLNSYLTNYDGPAAVAFPAIAEGISYSVTSAEYTDSTRFGNADATVGAQVTIRYPQINPVDKFYLKAIAKIRADSVANIGNVRRVLRLNPGLLATLTARANDNLSAVYLFKSCDGGNTFTTTGGVSGTCTSAPTRVADDATPAFPWRPINRVLYTNGIPANGQFQENVQPGRTYLYTYVTRTRGFLDIKIIDSLGAGLTSTNISVFNNLVADTISSAIVTSGPGAVNIYAPITEIAGRAFAKVDTLTLSGKATQDVQVTNVQNNASTTTRLVYANQIIVRKVIDTATSATTTTVSARWVIPRAATSATGTVVTNFVAREQTFTASLNIPVRRGTGITSGTDRGLVGSTRVFLDTIAPVANSMMYVWVTADNKPIYVTDNQYATNGDRDQLNSPLNPGFTVRSRDSSNAATGIRQEILPFGQNPRDQDYLIRAPGDTVQANAKQFAAIVQPIIAVTDATPQQNPLPKRTKGGFYKITWLIDPFGPGAPFRLDPPENLQAAVSASLNEVAKAASTVTVTDASYAAMIGATPARPLVRVRIPFTMTYTDPETGTPENVKFAMLARQGTGSKRLMGSGNDTLRVNVPDTLWMPGDSLFVLHKVAKDSAVGTGATRFIVVGPETLNGVVGFRPIQVPTDTIGLNKFRVACNSGGSASGVRANAFDAVTCNPLVINSRGASPTGGYLPVAAGWTHEFFITKTFDPRSTVQLKATPLTTTNAVSKANLDEILVVPNPYVVRGDMDELNARTNVARIYFTGVPEQGTLRVYSVSGQYLQELKWTRSDLIRTGMTTPTGDLPWNLRSREGTDLASGLYIFVLTATGPNGKDQVKRGKFVVIR